MELRGPSSTSPSASSSSASSSPTLRRERKKWEKEAPFTPFVDYKEFGKWDKSTSSNVLNIDKVSERRTSIIAASTSPPNQQQSSYLSPPPHPIIPTTPPFVPPSASSLSPVSTTSTSSAVPLKHVSHAEETAPPATPQEISLFDVNIPVTKTRSIQRTSNSFKMVAKSTKPATPNSSNTNEVSTPVMKSASRAPATPTSTVNNNTNTKSNASAKNPSTSKSRSTPSSPYATPQKKKPPQDNDDNVHSSPSGSVMSFIVGTVKILAYLASLRDDSEKQKDIKLASLEKRCRERLPDDIGQLMLDVLSEFRFLNALYETPDMIVDIRTTNQDFENKARFLSQNIPEKYLVYGDEKKSSTKELNAAVNKLIETNLRRVNTVAAKIELTQAIESRDKHKIERAIKAYKESGVEGALVTAAQSVLICLQQIDQAIQSRNTEALQAAIEKTAALKLVDLQYAKERLDTLQREKILLHDVRKASSERDPAALVLALKAADNGGVPNELLLEHRSILNNLEVKTKAIKDISSACNTRDFAKLSFLVEQGKSLLPPPDAPLHGVDTKLHEAIATASSLTTKLQEEARVKSLIEEAIRAEDRTRIEAACAAAKQLGLSQDVQKAQQAIKALDKIRLKCHYAQDIRVLLVPRSLPFLELKDDVGDLITIASNEEWEDALTFTNAHTAGKLDLFIEDEKVLEKIGEKKVVDKKEKDLPAPSKATHVSQGSRMALAASVQQLYSLLASDRLVVNSPAPAPIISFCFEMLEKKLDRSPPNLPSHVSDSLIIRRSPVPKERRAASVMSVKPPKSTSKKPKARPGSLIITGRSYVL